MTTPAMATSMITTLLSPLTLQGGFWGLELEAYVFGFELLRAQGDDLGSG